MTPNEINGLCPPRFDPVREVFAANFADDGELGARFSLAIEGEIVLDLYGGHADRARTSPFDAKTVAPVFSVTKAMAALLIARLVSQGRLDYGQTIASIWPEFAAAGKGEITVGQLMSHQAGLCGFPEPMDPALWFDWDAICAKLAAIEPLWTPGTASGYHPITFGYLAGEVFRRIDGRTMGRALAEDIAGPFDLDLWIGLPASEQDRCAEMIKPRAPAKFGALTEPVRAAFLTRWASTGGASQEDWRKAEIPSANGHAAAAALARMMAILANDGVLDGKPVLSPGVAAKVLAEQIRGRDLVLPFEISWGAGLMRNVPNMVYGPGEKTAGHSGWGGACAFADPGARVSGAYVMNRQSPALIGDARAVALINAAYECL